MPVTNQKYALVTDKGWRDSLDSRWPYAPLVGDYRLLVFAGESLPEIEREYPKADFKFLPVDEIISRMVLGEIGPFICDIEGARTISNRFNEEEI